MKKISGATFVFKKLIPTFVFVFLGSFLVAPILPGGQMPFPSFIFIPLVMAIFPFLLFKKTVWDLADVVYDNGDELIFRKGKKEQHISLRDIINISYPSFNSPQRIEVHVRSTGEIGKVLVFKPPMRLIPLGRNPLVLDLIERVDSARNS